MGTNAKLAARLKEVTGRDVDVASNPEFLKEGMAIDDFMKPDRVVVGARRQEVIDVLADLYQPYLRTDKPLLAMSPESAEMTKYAANAMLATKISFINEVANFASVRGPTSTRSAAASATTAASASRSCSPASATAEAVSPRTFVSWRRRPGSTASSRPCSTRSTKSTSGKRRC